MRFCIHLSGRSFTVEKPLNMIMMKILISALPWLQQPYDLSLKMDQARRYPVMFPQLEEEISCLISRETTLPSVRPTYPRLREIASCPVLSVVYHLTNHSWPALWWDDTTVAWCNWDICDELSTDDGFLVKGSSYHHFTIPPRFPHHTHLQWTPGGISKYQQTGRSTIY